MKHQKYMEFSFLQRAKLTELLVCFACISFCLIKTAVVSIMCEQPSYLYQCWNVLAIAETKRPRAQTWTYLHACRIWSYFLEC